MRRFVIAEMSMSPALLPGDRLLTRRLRRPRRGKVVFFPHPHQEDFWLVKRILGVAGDRIGWETGRATENGRLVVQSAPHGAEGGWIVPANHMFVVSDALDLTRADSRTFGPVPTRPAYVAVLRYRRARR